MLATEKYFLVDDLELTDGRYLEGSNFDACSEELFDNLHAQNMILLSFPRKISCKL